MVMQTCSRCSSTRHPCPFGARGRLRHACVRWSSTSLSLSPPHIRAIPPHPDPPNPNLLRVLPSCRSAPSPCGPLSSLRSRTVLGALPSFPLDSRSHLSRCSCSTRLPTPKVLRKAPLPPTPHTRPPWSLPRLFTLAILLALAVLERNGHWGLVMQTCRTRQTLCVLPRRLLHTAPSARCTGCAGCPGEGGDERAAHHFVRDGRDGSSDLRRGYSGARGSGFVRGRRAWMRRLWWGTVLCS